MRHDLFRFSGFHIPRIAILISRSDAGTHTGIIYLDDVGIFQLIDFQADGSISQREWRGNHPHVIPNADEDALSNLAALCQVIAKRYKNRQPEHLYGFRYNTDARINPITGELFLGNREGVTCASFILIVFKSAGIPLVVETPDWPYRPGADDVRHEQLIQLLANYELADESRQEELRQEIQSPRVAPEEVAGAGMCSDPPANQSFAEKAAKWILDLLEVNSRHGF